MNVDAGASVVFIYFFLCFRSSRSLKVTITRIGLSFPIVSIDIIIFVLEKMGFTKAVSSNFAILFFCLSKLVL